MLYMEENRKNSQDETDKKFKKVETFKETQRL